MNAKTTIPLLCAAALAAAAPATDAAGQPLATCTIKPKKSYSVDALLEGRAKIATTCDGPAAVLLGMTISSPQYLDLRMPGNGIQDVAGTADFAAAGTKNVKVTMDRRSRKRLSKGDKSFSGRMLVAVGQPGSRRYRSEPGGLTKVTFRR